MAVVPVTASQIYGNTMAKVERDRKRYAVA